MIKHRSSFPPNRADFLAHTLRGMARQTAPREVIVADDGSYDATRAVVDSFSDRLAGVA